MSRLIRRYSIADRMIDVRRPLYVVGIDEIS